MTNHTHIHPFAKRSLGQNFLQDRNIAAKIVAALNIAHDDRVLEIGPGRGALTEHIVAQRPSEFVVIEKDEELAAALEERWPTLTVRHGDALEFGWAGLNSGWKLIGNLPYNIASPLLWDLVSQCRQFEKAVFMVQFEVARRLATGPGSKEYGALSAWVQSFVDVRLLFKVGPNAFKPRPNVDSAVVAMTPLKVNFKEIVPGALANLLKFCFSQRRKQLGTILRPHLNEEVLKWFDSNNLKLSQRPEELTPEQFRSLAILLQNRIKP